MKTVKIIAGLVFLIMCGNVLNVSLNSGMGHGVGFDTFLAGARDPWQTFINNDLVMGLVLTMSWVIFRERGGRVLNTVAWVWMAAWWGNIVIAAYVLRAAYQADSDWSRFFLGRHAPGATAPAPMRLPALMRALCGLGAAAAAVYLALGLRQSGGALVPVLGYALGFLPVILSLALLALPRRAA
ncbi:hypothetical protein GCM10010909_01290 [Acidocella aquatica]|uniref:Uncharacterized protein n=1 Tax=Acidocella aquatica TaxID=1922313 RepID=A0ABQ5ZZ03_9PROT|nr:hypothetical protein [Acidocella aquatica]GLR65451.1 hypothetical protein GCM10010909_01290 [Acidocella aquatica]